MNCFDLVCAVLDELWQEMEGDDQQKSWAVKEEIIRLSINYLDISRNPILGYSRPVTQFAYVFKYASTHGDYLYQLLCKVGTQHTFFENNCFRTVSLGGGPGSDLIGCLKFLEARAARDLRFTYHSFDRDKHWRYCWAKVKNCVTQNRCKAFFPAFHELDITEKSATWRIKKFLNADLYTMLFFMSAVSKKREDAAPFFKYFFENVNKGALIAFIDNNTESIFSWFDAYMNHRYETVAAGKGLWFASVDEQKSSVKKYMQLLEHTPRIKGDIAYRLVRKT